MPIIENRRFKFILQGMLLISILVSVMLCFPDQYDDYDIWWHLKYGEHFVTNHTWFIDHSMFSWTPAMADWKYVSWLGDSLMYIVFSLFSFAGLYSIQIVSLLGIYCMYLCYLKSIGDSLNALHVLSLYLVSYCICQAYVKTELFSVFLFALVAFVFIQSRTSSKPLFYLYPLLFMLWVNIHGVYIFGILFVTVLFLLELLNFVLIKRNPLPSSLIKAFAVSVVLSYIALLVNPYGIQYHLSLLKDLFFSDYMHYTVGYIQAFGNLWRQLFPTGFSLRPIQLSWFLIIMMAIFVLVNAYVYVKTKKVEPSIILINLLFFLLSMMAGRARYYFPLIWLFSMPYLYRHVRERIAIPRGMKWIALVLFIYFSAVNIYFTLTLFPKLAWFGVNIAESVPEKEISFIKAHHLPGPFFNDYLTGGYMIWSMYPEYKVFIDPRYGPYFEEVRRDWFELKSRLNPEELERMTAKYRFKAALIDLRERQIVSWMLQSAEWKLVYFDKIAAVIVNRTFYNEHVSEFHPIDSGPSRFNGVTDPENLMTLFWTYAAISGDSRALNELTAIYRNNVRDYYAFKERDLRTMKFYVSMREKAINKPAASN